MSETPQGRNLQIEGEVSQILEPKFSVETVEGTEGGFAEVMDDGAIDPMTEEEEPKKSEEPTTASVQPIPSFDPFEFGFGEVEVINIEEGTDFGDVMTETMEQQKQREIAEAKEVARIAALEEAFKEKKRKEAEEAQKQYEREQAEWAAKVKKQFEDAKKKQVAAEAERIRLEKLEKERLRIEAERLREAAEQAARIEKERQEAEAIRIAEEAAAAKELAERREREAAEQNAKAEMAARIAKAEQERIAAEIEAARIFKEQAEQAARIAELQRKERERQAAIERRKQAEAERKELERQILEEKARIAEAARIEKVRQDIERKQALQDAKEAAERLEREKRAAAVKAAEEAARVERIRKEAEAAASRREAERIERERLENVRKAADAKAKLEAEERAAREIQRIAEVAKQEAERAAAREAARVEYERQKKLAQERAEALARKRAQEAKAAQEAEEARKRALEEKERQRRARQAEKIKRLREAALERKRQAIKKRERLARERKVKEAIERKRKEEERKRKLDFFDYMASQMDLDKRGKIEILEILKMYTPLDVNKDGQVNQTELLNMAPGLELLCQLPKIKEVLASKKRPRGAKYFGEVIPKKRTSFFERILKLWKRSNSKKSKGRKLQASPVSRQSSRRVKTSFKLKAYPFFALADTNKDGFITQQEYLNMTSKGGSFPLEYKEYANFLRKNIQAMCIDPRPEMKVSNDKRFDGILRPFADIYFGIDNNADGVVNPSEADKLFNNQDTNQNGKVNRKEFDVLTRKPLMRLCLASAKLWERFGCKDPLDDISVHQRTSGGSRCKLRRARMQRLARKEMMLKKKIKGRKLQSFRPRDRTPVTVTAREPSSDTSVLYKVYLSAAERKTWNQAINFCRANNSEIATILSKKERQTLYDQAGRNNLWIGAKRKSRRSKIFYWPNGQRVRNTQWLRGEPNNRMGRENCVALTITKKWRDVNCGYRLNFACEKRGAAAAAEREASAPPATEGCSDEPEPAIVYPPNARSCPGWTCSTEGQLCPPGAVGSSGTGYCCKQRRWRQGACLRPKPTPKEKCPVTPAPVTEKPKVVAPVTPVVVKPPKKVLPPRCHSVKPVVWKKRSGKARDIGVGANGAIWSIGEKDNSRNGGYIYRWIKSAKRQNKWYRMRGAYGKRISVDPIGNAWVVDKQGQVFYAKIAVGKGNQKATFEKKAGIRAVDIGVGAEGSVWAVGYPKNSYGFTIYKFIASSNTWKIVPGSAVRITVDRYGMPWVINSKSKVFKLNKASWVMQKGTGYDIGAGPDGSVFLVSTVRGKMGRGFEMQKFSVKEQRFVNISGHGQNVAVGPGGRPFITNVVRDLFWPVDACSTASHIKKEPEEDAPKTAKSCSVKYGLSSSRQNWNSAKKACASQKIGGVRLQMAQVHNQSEQNLLRKTVGNVNAWIGGHDRITERRYTWSDNRPITFTNWFAGQPEHTVGNKDCISLRQGDKWAAAECRLRQRFVCEKRVCVANCKHMNYQFNEGPTKNRCSSDCHCDGERTCSFSKFCTGKARKVLKNKSPNTTSQNSSVDKPFVSTTTVPLDIHKPRFMNWIQEPLCTPIYKRYPWERTQFITKGKSQKLKLAGIAAGAGKVFMLLKSTKIRGFGYQIIKQSSTNKTKWTRTKFGAMQMDVDHYGNPWIVNDANKLYAAISGTLTLIPGKVSRIAIQKNSIRPSIFALGAKFRSDNGKGIYKLNNSSLAWERLPGEAMRITVDNTGNPWIINMMRQIWRWKGTQWVKYPGFAKEIAAGGDGSLYVIGVKSFNNSKVTGVYKMNFQTEQWIKVGNNGRWLASGPGGRIHILIKESKLFQTNCGIVKKVLKSVTPSKACTKIYKPVCDCKTKKRYSNKCVAESLGATCPKSCAKVKKVCPAVYRPVCECKTNKKYSNACTAETKGVKKTCRCKKTVKKTKPAVAKCSSARRFVCDCKTFKRYTSECDAQRKGAKCLLECPKKSDIAGIPGKFELTQQKRCVTYNQIVWVRRPGLALSISAGADGTVWAVGQKKKVLGGYPLYKWNGKTDDSQAWEQQSRGAVKVATAPDGNPWILTNKGQIWGIINGEWKNAPGCAREIAIGANGTTYVLGCLKTKSGGSYIYKYDNTNNNFKRLKGTAVNITVDEFGKPWVVNTREHIYKWIGDQWMQMPGRATQIAAGPDGTIISIWGNRVYKWYSKEGKWRVVSTILTKQTTKLKWLHERSLSVGKDGQPFLVTNVGRIFWPKEPCASEESWNAELDRRKKEKANEKRLAEIKKNLELKAARAKEVARKKALAEKRKREQVERARKAKAKREAKRKAREAKAKAKIEKKRKEALERKRKIEAEFAKQKAIALKAAESERQKYKGLFYVETKPNDWWAAQLICMKWGGDLVSVHNNAENKLIRRLIGNDKPHWIGMHEIRKEGTWQWMDNTRYNYAAWDEKKKQPRNNGGDEDCTATFKEGKWHDLKCTRKLPFVCKKARFGKGINPKIIEVVTDKPKKVVRDNGLFNLLDADANDKLIVDEVFGMFKQGDKNSDYKLDSEELFWWILTNEQKVCRGYEWFVDKRMSKGKSGKNKTSFDAM